LGEIKNICSKEISFESQMLARIGGVIAGVLVGGLVVALVEYLSSRRYPMPEGLDTTNKAALGAWISTLPLNAMIFVLVAHALGAGVGGAVCAMVMGEVWWVGPMIVGAMFEVGGIMNLVSVPGHPTWFAVVDVLLYFPCAWLGANMAYTAALLVVVADTKEA